MNGETTGGPDRENDGQDEISEDTKAAEARDAEAGGRADRPPTPEEEELAEEMAQEAPDVEGSYREMTERGAKVQGEGRIG
jgi:hypothetical protein